MTSSATARAEVGGHVDDVDDRAAAREQQRDAAADPGAGAGDDGDAAAEFGELHGWTVCRRWSDVPAAAPRRCAWTVSSQ